MDHFRFNVTSTKSILVLDLIVGYVELVVLQSRKNYHRPEDEIGTTETKSWHKVFKNIVIPNLKRKLILLTKGVKMVFFVVTELITIPETEIIIEAVHNDTKGIKDSACKQAILQKLRK